MSVVIEKKLEKKFKTKAKKDLKGGDGEKLVNAMIRPFG
jgi:hypothetical protein